MKIINFVRNNCGFNVTYIYMEPTREALYQEFYDAYSIEDSMEQKKKQLQIRRKVDRLPYFREETLFQSFPYYNEPDFSTQLSKKAEIFHQKNIFDEKNLQDSCLPQEFELGKHQEFLRNFMNGKTPYHGVLVFHGVGVGKTCSAITISQSFRDIYQSKEKRIICLVSENIKPGWMKQIHDPSKGENQCTGTSFQVESDETNLGETQIQREKKTKKMIKKYYDFMGYGKFANTVETLLRPFQDLPEREKKHKEKELIQLVYSDRLLIIDEAHNLRDENETMGRKVLEMIDKVVQYSKNMRLVLLTATPLFNKPSEITWLLNLLLKNDNRPTIKPKEVFQGGKLTEQGKQILQDASRGYVSYLRGENPVSFPIRLYPDSDKDKLCADPQKSPDKYPQKDMFQIDIPEYRRFLKLYQTKLGSLQSHVYENFMETLSPESLVNPMERRKGIQMLNMVYPLPGILPTKRGDAPNYEGIQVNQMYGDKGLSNVMKSSLQGGKRVYRYQTKYLKELGEFPPCFDTSQIKRFSGKINAILDKVKQSTGIVFIYSEYLSSGLIPLALALEHMGYGKYGSQNLWDQGTLQRPQPIDSRGKPCSEAKQAKYILLSGTKDLSPNNREEIKQLVSDSNLYGDKIKIVLGNVVASEGLDFKNIREVHILEPWFHLFRLEQIIGRAIRRCSHMNLPEEERNVTVYHHSASLKKKETLDTNTYRLAEQKAITIGEIETILKKTAIDCFLNQGSNQIKSTDVNPRNLITSQGTQMENYDVSDKAFSKICSFQDTCEYSCETTESISLKDVHYDTFSVHNSTRMIEQIQKIIQELYLVDNYYTLDEIVQTVTDTIDCNVPVVYISLQKVISHKKPIWNASGDKGTLLQRGDIYYFQPYTNQDPLLPLYFRTHGDLSFKEKSIDLQTVFTQKIHSKKVHIEKVNLDKLYQRLFQNVKIKTDGTLTNLSQEETTFVYDNKEYNFESIINLTPEIVLSHKLDTLTYNEKQILLCHIIEENIPFDTSYKPSKETQFNRVLFPLKENQVKANQMILQHFKHNLIQDKDGTYVVEFDPSLPIVGFFLLNTPSFFKKQPELKETENVMDDFTFQVWKDGIWNPVQNLPTGNVLLRSFKKSLQTMMEQLSFRDYYGVSYKNEKQEHQIKLMDMRKRKKGTIGGFNIQQMSQIKRIQALIKGTFKHEYSKYQELLESPENIQKRSQGRRIHEESVKYLSLFMEMLLRQKDSKYKKTYYLPYDLFLLEYL